jgi:Spy/CpxP family protein refolding chaperone
MRKLSIRATSTGIGATVVLAGWLAMAGTPSAAGVNDSDRTLLSADQGPGRTAAPNAWEWWNDAEIQKALGLSGEKIKRINDIYNRRNAEIQPLFNEFHKQWSELDKMTRARVVDESTYWLQVLRVETARSRLSEFRTMMLYRLYRELTPEQHQKLQEIQDRRRSGGRGRGPDGR